MPEALAVGQSMGDVLIYRFPRSLRIVAGVATDEPRYPGMCHLFDSRLRKFVLVDFPRRAG